MPDPAIKEFLQKRKEELLQKRKNEWQRNNKTSMEEEDLLKLVNECEKKFSYEGWLPDASKRAGQIKISSHPCTFSHPSARKNKNGYATTINANEKHANDGYVRTGNISVEKDALGNAAALDVYKFLTLTMRDGKSLLEHIKSDSELAKSLLSINSVKYEDLKTGFLRMIKNEVSESITSSKIKQVYFPIGEDEYHLLSILSNSGMIYELRRRIDDLRFSEKQKELRELKSNGKYSEKGFSEIYNIATIGYGGTKPQNISVLNNQFGGKARLLMSTPPQIENREIQFPRSNFFKNTINIYDIHEPIKELHRIFKTGLGNGIPLRNLRSGRDYRIEKILDNIIHRMIAVRSVASEQYREKTSTLPGHQKMWLCNEYCQKRQEQNEWLDELCGEISRWIVFAYKKNIKKPIDPGPEEIHYICKVVETHREVFR